MPETILLMLCVNDPDNGNHTGRVVGIEFGTFSEPDEVLMLESSFWDWGPVCRAFVAKDGSRRIKIGRRAFPIRSYRTWVGNWCWDAAAVTVETANEILAYLRSQHDRQGNPYWTPDSGWTEVFEAWERGESIDLAKYIREAAHA